MAKAFECWNASNYYQIDSLYPNLRLVTKGTIACTTPIPGDQNGAAAKNYTGDISVAAANPIIAFRCDNYCSSIGIGFDGNNYTHRFYTRGQANVDWWAFATNPVGVSAGLEVYNESGILVFTSQDKPAKVCGNLEVDGSVLHKVNEWTFAGIRKLAVVVSSSDMNQAASSSFTIIINTQARVVDSARLGTSNEVISAVPPKINAGRSSWWSNFLLLDVFQQ